MKNIFICMMLCFGVHAQENWSLESTDGLAEKKNFKKVVLSDRFEIDDPMNNMFYEVVLDVETPTKIEG